MARKAQQPADGWQVNQRAAQFVDGFLKAPGGRVGGNPQNLPQQGQVLQQSNLYGDGSRAYVPEGPVLAPPAPAFAQVTTPQPWMANEVNGLQESLSRQLPKAGPSPLDQMPNELVMNNQPIARPGMTGYEGAPLPPAAPVDFAELALAARPEAFQPMISTAAETNPYLSMSETYGTPNDARFPSPQRKANPGNGRGKPASMPKA